MKKCIIDETIAAVATPAGNGGVAIVRVSGPESIEIVDRLFSGSVHRYQTHTAHYGVLSHPSNGSPIDQVLVLPMLGERSYTGEDTVEIHCHGGRKITERVLEAVLASGARAAGPGEFTQRAFLNGKLDLAQAEAVQELIAAKNDRALDSATQHLQGRLSERIRAFQSRLVSELAMIEAWLDFPDEGLEFTAFEVTLASLVALFEEMNRLHSTYRDGKIVSEGISLALIGAPNVGKSSLMNALLDKERAIVTDVPGTTRDLIEDHFSLNGVTLKLVDTAGIRAAHEAVEIVESEGIRRSHAMWERADLVLMVCDGSRPLRPEERERALAADPSKTLLIWNKADLGVHVSISEGKDAFSHIKQQTVSTLTGEGMAELCLAIDRVIWENGPPDTSEVMITSLRHKESLLAAIRALESALVAIRAKRDLELVTIDLRAVGNHLGQIIGIDLTEDVLTAIFSHFCIGK